MLAMKLEQLLKNTNTDEIESKLIIGLIEACFRYVEIVILTSRHSQLERRFAKNIREYAEESQALDSRRRFTHTSLIASMKAVDRLCSKNNMPLICGKNYDRQSASEFAIKITNEYFNLGQGHKWHDI